HSALDLLKTYGASGPDLQKWLADNHAAVNRDRDLRLQYLAGFGANVYLEAQIYDDIKDNRTWPDALFVGLPEEIGELREAIAPKPQINLENLGKMLGGQ
ncbi:MAG TPA: hypothetical protein VHC95_09810, partial [Opitutales bacterium]|nr:hypothetical protein [Opitutales bacterium]